MSIRGSMLFYLALAWLNAGFSIVSLMSGNIFIGVFNGVVAVWCLAFMVAYIFKGVNE